MVAFTPTSLTEKQQKRFWSHVDKSGECWVWVGARVKGSDYGFLGYTQGNSYAHRVSWVIANGPIPDGLFVLHRCDNRPCVRPDHLFVGTKKDNTADARSKGRLRGGWRRHHLTEEEVVQVRWDNCNGESQRAIAERLGISWQGVNRIVSGKSYSQIPLPIGPKAPRKHRRLFSEEDVLLIRNNRQNGALLRELADHFDASESAIRGVVSGRSYRQAVLPA